MTAMTGPIASKPLPLGKPRTTLESLDALCAGVLDEDTFLRTVKEVAPGSPEASWEALSLLDQYYRRGKIKLEPFQRLKSHFQFAALGTDSAEEVKVPLRHLKAAPRAAGDAIPIGASVHSLATQPVAAAATPTASVEREAASAQAREHRQIGGPVTPAVNHLLRDRYRLQKVLGQGGMGTVFEATDQYRVDVPGSSQRLAIKVLNAAVTERQELFTELRREFQLLQSLSHPNIVRVHEFDRDGDTAFFTMELLHGSLLSDVLRARHPAPLDRSHALAIIRGVCDALAHAHSRGVVHGDVSPQNIFITNEGEVRLFDFGAAHRLAPGPRISDFESPQHLPVATPDYASCQLLEGQRPDAHDDLFAVACLAYVLLTNAHPFKNHTASEARALHLRPRRPSGLTRRQWRALQQGLAFEREQRPVSVEEWLHRLDLQKNPRAVPSSAAPNKSTPTRDKTPNVNVVIAAILLMLAAGFWAKTNYKSLVGAVTRLSAGGSSAMQRMATIPLSVTEFAHHAAANTLASVVANTQAPSVATQAPPPGAESATITVAPLAAPISAEASEAAKAASTTTVDSPPKMVASPSRAGNPPSAHIELATDVTEVQPGAPFAQVVVRRLGGWQRDVTFNWWTESGTAKAGNDFESVVPRVEHIDAGKGRVNLLIPVVSDSTRHQTKNFYVVIDQAGPVASLGTRTVAMVSILAPN
jgi:serine/threonine protein kinase